MSLLKQQSAKFRLAVWRTVHGQGPRDERQRSVLQVPRAQVQRQPVFTWTHLRGLRNPQRSV